MEADGSRLWPAISCAIITAAGHTFGRKDLFGWKKAVSFLNVHTFIILCVTVVVPLYNGCTDRNRSNPVDPENPITHGRPTGLQLTAIRDTVTLSWDRVRVDDLTGIRVYRKKAPADEFEKYAVLNPGATGYVDNSVNFGVEYNYQITAFGRDFESAPSKTIIAEPGPTFSFVANNHAGVLTKLTHDTRHVLKQTVGFLAVVDVEPCKKTGNVWIIDLFSQNIGSVIRMDSNGKTLSPIIELRSPRALAIDETTGDVWVVDRNDSLVVKYNLEGQELFTAQGFVRPIAAAVDQSSGACWVGDSGADVVIKLSRDGTSRHVSTVDFQQIRSVAVDSSDGNLWISDASGVQKLAASGDFLFRVENVFTEPHKLVVDNRDGSVWVANWNPSSIIKLDSGGTKLFQIDGFANPEDLAVNCFDGSSLIADTENNRVVKILSDGSEVRTVQKIPAVIAVGILNTCQ